MKTRSKALYQYLLESGVLHGTKEDIAQAKLQYRKIYKKSGNKEQGREKKFELM